MANITNAHCPWAPPLDILWRQLGADRRYLADPEMLTPNPFRFNSGKVIISDRHRHVWRAEMEFFPPKLEEHAVEFAPEMVDHLRALGYVA